MNDLMRRRGARIEDSTVRGSQSEPENPLDFQPSLPIEKKEYNGVPVVTLKDIDCLHQRKDGSAWQNFNSNRKHFIEGVDYYHLKASEFQNLKFSGFEIGKRGTLLFTQTGYLMIVKSFTDDLSWAIQRELVNGYFAAQRAGLTFMGTPVIPLNEAAKALGIWTRTAVRKIEAGGFGMGDALLLEGRNLARFKAENAQAHITASALWIITRSGFEKLKQA